jgi:hypothetical protein
MFGVPKLQTSKRIFKKIRKEEEAIKKISG